MPRDNNQTTTEEIQYLEGLGGHLKIKGNRTELIKAYIRSIPNRDWGRMNRKKIEEFAKSLL